MEFGPNLTHVWGGIPAYPDNGSPPPGQAPIVIKCVQFKNANEGITNTKIMN